MNVIGKKIKNSLRSFINEWLPAMSWGIAGAMIVFTILVLLYGDLIQSHSTSVQEKQSGPTVQVSEAQATSLPELSPPKGINALVRLVNPRTIIATQPRRDVVEYTVEKRDSIFGIANKFNLEPETILWANFEQLEDNPDMLKEGQVLNIPPVDGVYYMWQEEDTLETVAEEHKILPEDIVAWSANKLDMTNPVIEPETYVMIPGGGREMQQWVMPVVPLHGEATGVSTNVMGPGGCTVNQVAYGSGGFIYPTRETRISGNDYWSGHLGIDLACGIGDPLRASDGGTLVYSGWAGGGYGNTVVIDHGTGYQTLYAHLTSVALACGGSVSQGTVIGFCGSTGNSTGPHLHFEVRYLGGFINPWYVLP